MGSGLDFVMGSGLDFVMGGGRHIRAVVASAPHHEMAVD